MNEKNSQEDSLKNEEIEENSKNNTNLSNKEVDKESIPIEQTIEEKLKETEEKLLRSLAEIENQRRRFEKEVKDAFEFGSFNFAKEALAILDNLYRAKEAIKNDEKLKDNKDLDKFLDNITIVQKDLVTIFEKNRIKKIEVSKKKFDPNFHQAMSEIEDDTKEPGSILHEIQAGYMLGDRLLRPSLVSVSKKKTIKDQANKDKKMEK